MSPPQTLTNNPQICLLVLAMERNFILCVEREFSVAFKVHAVASVQLALIG